MEGPHPDLVRVVAERDRYPPAHLVGRAVGEREREDALRVDARRDKVGDPAGERPCLPRAGSRDHQDGTGGLRGTLLALIKGEGLDPIPHPLGRALGVRRRADRLSDEHGPSELVEHERPADTDARGDGRGGEPGIVPLTKPVGREEELASEDVGLALGPFAGAVSLNASDAPDGPLVLGRLLVDLAGEAGVPARLQPDVGELVGLDEPLLFGRRVGVVPDHLPVYVKLPLPFLQPRVVCLDAAGAVLREG